jgi:hypothetical protein
VLPALVTVVALTAVAHGPAAVHAATTSSTPKLTLDTRSCKSVKACVNVTNIGSGPAAVVTAPNASGGLGNTAELNAPIVTVNTLGLDLTGGLVGNDVSKSPALGGGNSGVVGTSTYAYGMFGVTYNAYNYNAGTDVTTFGAVPAIFGLDVGPNTGIDGSGNVGIAGRSLTRVGGLFLSRSGYGAVGRSFTGTGVLGVGRAAGAIALAATSLAGGPVFVGNNATSQVAALDSNGNLLLAGNIQTGDTAQFATASTTGARVVTYGARTSVATIEDFGEAQMRGGVADVTLDPAFARVIDPQRPYLVFITPEGDNRGVYVTGKTASAFTVRESAGARDSLAFSYRIVAHAFGAHDTRFPTAASLPRSTTARPAVATAASGGTSPRLVRE